MGKNKKQARKHKKAVKAKAQAASAIKPTFINMPALRSGPDPAPGSERDAMPALRAGPGSESSVGAYSDSAPGLRADSDSDSMPDLEDAVDTPIGTVFAESSNSAQHSTAASPGMLWHTSLCNFLYINEIYVCSLDNSQ
jgi:hypothetical protein